MCLTPTVYQPGNHRSRLRVPDDLSTISELIHDAGEKAHAISTGKEEPDVRRVAETVAIIAEAQLRMIEQLSRRPLGDGVPLGERVGR